MAGTVSNNTAFSELPQEVGSAYSLTTYDDLYNAYDTSDVANDPLLSQPQLVARFQWSTTDGFNNLLATINQTPTRLMHLTTGANPVNNPLARILSGYAFFKADIEYTIWTTGNANSSGAIMIGTRYDRNPLPTTCIQNLCCDPNMTLLHAQSQEKVTFIVPYKSAIWNAVDPAVLRDYWGVLYAYVLQPYSNATSVSPPSMTVYVQARFVNMKIAGPTTSVFQSSRGGPTVRKSRGGAKPNKAMRKKAFRTKTHLDELYTKLRAVHKEIDAEKAKMMGEARTGASAPAPATPAPQIFGGPVPSQYQSSFKKEAQKVASMGLNFVKDQIPGSRVALSLAKTAGRFFAPKLVDELEGWGFNYPLNSNGLQNIKTFAYHPLCQEEGVLTAINLNGQVYDPTEQIEDPMGHDYMEYSNYLSLKSWCHRFTFDTTMAADSSLTAFPISPAYSFPTIGATTSTINPSPLQWVTNKHKFWRGTLKYRFHFFVPTGVTATVRISQLPITVASASSTVASEDAGSYMSTLVYLSKDTIFDFKCAQIGRKAMKNVTYNPTQFSNYNMENTHGIIQVSLATPAVNSFAVTAAIGVHVFVESDPDDPIRFFGLKDDSDKTYQSGLIPSEGVPPAEQDGPALPMAPVKLLSGDGFCTSDEYHSFKQQATRGYRQTQPTTIFAVDPFTYMPDFLKKTFVAWRGAFRFQPTFAASPSIKLMTSNYNFTSSLGLTPECIQATVDPAQIFEVPYSANVPWREFVTERERNDIFMDYAKISGAANGGAMPTWFSDDVQLFIPSFCPQIMMNNSVV